jgi:hypothetical protein
MFADFSCRGWKRNASSGSTPSVAVPSYKRGAPLHSCCRMCNCTCVCIRLHKSGPPCVPSPFLVRSIDGLCQLLSPPFSPSSSSSFCCVCAFFLVPVSVIDRTRSHDHIHYLHPSSGWVGLGVGGLFWNPGTLASSPLQPLLVSLYSLESDPPIIEDEHETK